nr:MAG: ORF1 [TTV-like mini virus]UGV35989.1 MAG: ORF1 [TTV-like mini virus]
MPYWYRRWRTRRRRWPRWRRARAPFRRQWRRRYWVRPKRPRKRLKIPIQEWQPEKINRLTIKGLYPLFSCDMERISNNNIQWLESIAPANFPGGGGFSIMQFTLQALYEEYVKARNWWTKSNCMLPLIRYRGVTLKLYRTESFDYIVNIHRCYPLVANDLLYMSTQPGIMGLTKRSIHVTCRKSSSNKKPYKRVRVLPPTQMNTGWYFQKDLANFPLLIITSTATSLDRYYLSSPAQSSTIGFLSLNTQIFQYHDWQRFPTSGYRPNDDMYLWGHHTLEDPKLEELIYLGGTSTLTEGTPIKLHHDSYATNPGYWGNIFLGHYLGGDYIVFKTSKTIQEVVTAARNTSTTVSQWGHMSKLTNPLLIECRYNPFADKSKNNKAYVVSNLGDHTKWDPPPDKPNVLRQDLPLWLLTWGHLDFLRKGGIVSQVDINYIYTIQSDFIQSTPKLKYYVPLDDNFTSDPQQSPYIGTLNASDRLHLYPKVTFQIKTINNIASTGPGTIKLQKQQSCEAHMEYIFHFKMGGCPAPMEKLCNPSDQPKYPIPNFKQQTTSLQSPTTAIQTYLYNFDERRGLLTKEATKRIKKDYGTETDSIQFAGSAMDLPTPYEGPPETDQTSSEEEEEETTFQLLKLRHKQQQLRHRILKLISKNIE